jgi:glycosyltransferase involved in cell wall biosynthesis
VACSSDFTLARLHHCMPDIPASKTARIYPIAALDSKPSLGVGLGAITAGPFLLAVAQHRGNKNLPLLIEGLARLRMSHARCEHLQLIIVGSEGPETKSLHKLVQRRSLSENVLFISELTEENLCWLYRNCEAVVVSSSVEGFCLPVVEAQHWKAMIVCSDIPVLREVGGAYCRYFSLEAGDPAAELAAAIAAALRKPKPESQMTQRFAPQKIARQFVALYRALVAGTSTRNFSTLGYEASSAASEEYAV